MYCQMIQKVGFCIMEFTQEEYTQHYIVTALFKLMMEYVYSQITITDIAKKAGVGRATFYRYFKCKEDIVLYYFKHGAVEFASMQRFLPRCREDYVQMVFDILKMFKENMGKFKLIRKARLESLYLDYLNKNFVKLFDKEHPSLNAYTPYLYAGMLFNISMQWLDNDCQENEWKLAEVIVNAIYS